jgi:hypothetical protein
MLSELRSELQHIEEAILVVQRLAAGGAKRRGRPPKWMSATAESSIATTPIRRTRKPFSAATRKKMAEAQRMRWAKIKKAA